MNKFNSFRVNRILNKIQRFRALGTHYGFYKRFFKISGDEKIAYEAYRMLKNKSKSVTYCNNYIKEKVHENT